MSTPMLTLTLAKVVIAAAWADGKLSPTEVNNLKDLLYHMPKTATERDMHLSAENWALLELYLSLPVGPHERARLVAELQDALWSPPDREFAMHALEQVVNADGVVTDDERRVVAEIHAALAKVDLGIFGILGHLLRGPVQRRTQALSNAPNREKYFEDYVRNKIYYMLRMRLDNEGVKLNLDEQSLRKLSLAGGLMAHIAHVDESVSSDESAAMIQALHEYWSLDKSAAALVVEVALAEVSAGLDFFRLTREFTELTSEEERSQFLDVLFAVADSDGNLSHEENEEVRRIALSIQLPKSHFADAKERRVHRLKNLAQTL